MKTRILPIQIGGSGPTPDNVYTKAEVDALIADFITNTVNDLVYYYDKSETLTTAEIQALVGQITSFEVVATLPVSDIKTNVIYLLGPIGSGSDRYEEYIYSNSTWIKIGETSLDLSNYVTITQLNTALSAYTPTSGLATVATSGSYNDLTNKPTISNIVTLTQAQYDALATKDPNTQYVISDATAIDMDDYVESSDLATVATSGSYNDLTDKPTIPSAQVNSDWTATSGVAEILHKPTLATVATSGDYNDLTNKPTIPAAQVNSDWSSNSGVSQILNKPTLSTVATSGDYADLTNKPTIPDAVSGTNDGTNWTNITIGSTTKAIPAAQVQSDWNANSGMGQILNKPTTVALTFTFSDQTTATYNIYGALQQNNS